VPRTTHQYVQIHNHLYTYLNGRPSANKNDDVFILQRRPKHEPLLGHVRDLCKDVERLCAITGVFKGGDEDFGDRAIKGDGFVIEDDMVYLRLAPEDG
jgi:hypothetical protein